MVRNSNGRFAPGNPGGPGRPPLEKETERLDALRGAASPDAWRAVCLRAVKQAIEGDARAREWLSRYLMPEVGAKDDSAELPADAEAGLQAMRSDPDYLEYLRSRALDEDN